MTLLEALSQLIVIAWWTLGIWSIVTGAIWYTWDRRKIRPLERRINRLDYEIEEIEGADFMRGETPESRALRKARDIDSMALNDEEERIDKFLTRSFPDRSRNYFQGLCAHTQRIPNSGRICLSRHILPLCRVDK